jgi:filamentous hemagglutinin
MSYISAMNPGARSDPAFRNALGDARQQTYQHFGNAKSALAQTGSDFLRVARVGLMPGSPPSPEDVAAASRIGNGLVSAAKAPFVLLINGYAHAIDADIYNDPMMAADATLEIATGAAELLLLRGRGAPGPATGFAESQANRGVDAGFAERMARMSPATSAADAIRLRNQLIAQEIAGGHAFEKHVLGLDNPAGAEFGDLGIQTRNQFAQHIENVINNATDSGQIRNGREFFYDSSTETVVIRNPRALDGGTAFRIDRNQFPDPMDYIRGLRNN